jgi:uncharacterized protein with HEPN domain
LKREHGYQQQIAVLKHISQIQEEYLEHLELENYFQNKITVKALKYNPAMLATAAHQVVLQSLEIKLKVKSTI